MTQYVIIKKQNKGIRIMKTREHCCLRPRSISGALLGAALIYGVCATAAPDPSWKIHDMKRPRPPVVEPGTPSTQDQAGRAPSDAVVLFAGKSLESWRSMDGSKAKWVVRDGYMESTPGSGYIRSLRNFGDCQLHVEFASPSNVEGDGQGRGNSGVFLMRDYEFQVLDSYKNDTYPDGQAAAVYGQYPPMVNASRGPGKWQSYDIVFIRPRFNDDGEVVSPAKVTLLHNGVLVQNNVEMTGPTGWMQRADYHKHNDKLPIALQDHGNPVRFRNVWVRELEPGRPEYTFKNEILDRYKGTYGDNFIDIVREGENLVARFGAREHKLYAASKTEFFAKDVDAEFTFKVNNAGDVTGMVFRIGVHKNDLEKTE